MKKLLTSIILCLSLCSFSDSPAFKREQNKITFDILNKNHFSWKVKVTDELGRVVYKKDIGSPNKVHRVFNFEQAFPGTYFIEITSGSLNYTKEVKI